MDASLYLTAKALHIISFTAWMAGMFYLPRLFVYHSTAGIGSELSETLKVMERKLLRFIINPAMFATFGFGIWLMMMTEAWTGGWFHAKVTLLLLLTAFHGMCARWRKQFERDANTKSEKFYRWANEVPTLLLIGIVLLAVMKPF